MLIVNELGYEVEVDRMSDYDIRPKPVWQAHRTSAERSAKARPNVIF